MAYENSESELEFLHQAKAKFQSLTEKMSSRLKEGERALRQRVLLTSQNIRNKKKTLRSFADRPRMLMRQTITGDKTKRIRDHVKEKTARQSQRVREKLHEPPVIRFFDKAGFLLGVVGLASTLWIFARYPAYFWWWYCLTIPALVCLRYYMYRKLKWQYFLIDFCYFAQASLLCSLFLFPHCTWLWKANYIISHGPLLWAIPTWRNSFVFHCLDKVTSIFIHGIPPLLMFCIRWHPSLKEGANSTMSKTFLMCPNDSDEPCYLSFGFILCVPVSLYLLWQVLYILKTELLDREKLSKDPMLVTSIRWLSEDNGNALNRLTLTLCRKCHLFKKDETFHADSWKTKVVFWIAQFVYTILTFLPTYLSFHNIYVNGALLWFVFLVSVWNGANYYFDVFSKKYNLKFAGSATSGTSMTPPLQPAVACEIPSSKISPIRIRSNGIASQQQASSAPIPIATSNQPSSYSSKSALESVTPSETPIGSEGYVITDQSPTVYSPWNSEPDMSPVYANRGSPQGVLNSIKLYSDY